MKYQYITVIRTCHLIYNSSNIETIFHAFKSNLYKTNLYLENFHKNVDQSVKCQIFNKYIQFYMNNNLFQRFKIF